MILVSLTADELWRGVVADSGSGARKGRGKRTKRKLKKDLNIGQLVGEGIITSQQKPFSFYHYLHEPVCALNQQRWKKYRKIVKTVFNMTARDGRRRSISCLVAVGNGNGAAKNRAIHYLYYIERYNNHTIYHDIDSTFKRTTLRMKKQNEGKFLTSQPACTLQSRETHQALADRKQLNVVEFRDEQGPLPIVVAKPQLGARKDPEQEDEVPNTRLHWADVQAAQGMKRSVWAGVKRTIW
uniref:Mitochondrial ribosomal protein S5 n=1 Tax=Astyanax mexicanus TaxID=7994 RepID=A0A8B9LK15_ASTMX